MNKVVLITGSARGIGASTARLFASNKYDIILNDYFNSNLLETTKESIKKDYNVNIEVYNVDVSNEKEAIIMIDDIINKYGKIDVLVNNAAIVYDMPVLERTIEIFEETIKNNISSCYLMSKRVGHYMVEAKHGKIINISSTNGINTSYPMSIDYDASKAAIISLTKNMALELSPYVNVNAIAPGWVNTDMNKELDKEFIKEEEKKICLKRFAEPVEIAKLIYFLASDKASYINGEVIRVDGGMI